MAAHIKVTPEQLLSVSGQLTAGANSIESTLGRLASQVAPLGADWAGAAQARFHARWNEWQQGSRMLHQALEDIALLMQRASVSFETNDQQVASSFGR